MYPASLKYPACNWESSQQSKNIVMGPTDAAGYASAPGPSSPMPAWDRETVSVDTGAYYSPAGTRELYDSLRGHYGRGQQM
eukprot:scaffold558688_cov32-Prasinocladus_malaysianus.AAC.1